MELGVPGKEVGVEVEAEAVEEEMSDAERRG